MKEFLEEHLRYELALNEKGCWLFTGGSKNGHHGSLYYKGEPWQAHRLAWTLTKGEIPKDLHVLHECDIPRCVNPQHLFLGTQQDNNTDMEAKGRDNYPQPGERNGRALIKADDVVAIRNLYAQGKTQKEIAQQYTLSQSAVAKIVNKRTWSHI